MLLGTYYSQNYAGIIYQGLLARWERVKNAKVQLKRSLRMLARCLLFECFILKTELLSIQRSGRQA